MVFNTFDVLDISGAIELCWLLAIGKASSFGAGLDISMSRHLKTKKTQNNVKLYFCIYSVVDKSERGGMDLWVDKMA